MARDSEMQEFTRILFQGRPDLSTLTHSIVRQRFLAHVGRDHLEPEEKQALKRLVEEELLKMQVDEAGTRKKLDLRKQVKRPPIPSSDPKRKRLRFSSEPELSSAASSPDCFGFPAKNGMAAAEVSPAEKSPRRASQKEMGESRDEEEQQRDLTAKMGLEKVVKESSEEEEEGFVKTSEIWKKDSSEEEEELKGRSRKKTVTKKNKQTPGKASASREQAREESEDSEEEPAQRMRRKGEGKKGAKSHQESEKESEDEKEETPAKNENREEEGGEEEDEEKEGGEEENEEEEGGEEEDEKEEGGEEEDEEEEGGEEEDEEEEGGEEDEEEEGGEEEEEEEEGGEEEEEEERKCRATSSGGKRLGWGERSLKQKSRAGKLMGDRQDRGEGKGKEATGSGDNKGGDEILPVQRKSKDRGQCKGGKRQSGSSEEDGEDSLRKMKVRNKGARKTVKANSINGEESDLEREVSDSEAGGSPKEERKNRSSKKSSKKGKTRSSSSSSSDGSPEPRGGKAVSGRHGEDHPAVMRLKRYIRACGAYRNYKKLLGSCHSHKERLSVLRAELEALGMKGNPSLEKCRALKEQREEAAEVASLDVANIISSSGRPRRRTAWNPSGEAASSGEPYRRTLDSDEERPRHPPPDWSHMRGIISSDGESN
ncbi:HIRA-interacting protein 3 isoform X2 [Loxodonta africana]|uniref:HIRA-interacting protein 3 isoform X2 n=1 Tax=Loxodonta africana TaxID=9785 RepID=UPI0030D0DC7D